HATAHFSIAESGKKYAELFSEMARRRDKVGRQIAPGSPPAALGLRAARAASGATWMGRVRLVLFLLSPFSLIRTWRNARLYRRVPRIDLAHQFDSAYYLRTYPDVARSGIPPLLHYVFRGYLEGRNPSAAFDTKEYL